MHSVDLVKLAQGGDKDSFSELIRNYEKDLYRISIAIVKNDDDALDAIQDTIIKTYENLETLKNPEYFKTWLIKILINSCNTLMSKRKKVVSLYDHMENTYDSDICEELDVHRSINKLSSDLRLIVVLFYFEQLSIKEIMDSINLPEGTVKSRLSRARKELKRLLKYNEKGCV